MTRFHDVSNNESYHIRMLHALHDRDLLSELLRHAVWLEHTLECDETRNRHSHAVIAVCIEHLGNR